MKKKLYNFRLPEDMMGQVDAKTKNKTEYIIDLIENDLHQNKEKSLHNNLHDNTECKTLERLDEKDNNMPEKIKGEINNALGELRNLMELCAKQWKRYEEVAESLDAKIKLFHEEIKFFHDEIESIRDKYRQWEIDAGIRPIIPRF
jgi:archaellum component FlaC